MIGRYIPPTWVSTFGINAVKVLAMRRGKITDFLGQNVQKKTHQDNNSECDKEPSDGERERSPIKRVAGVPCSVASCDETTGRIRKFPRSWLQKCPWLEYDEVNKSMICKDCRAANIAES